MTDSTYESDAAGDIVNRLREACVGHPYAAIPWPHRILHEAAEEIDSLRKQLAALRPPDRRTPWSP